jgi:hypothetical protein
VETAFFLVKGGRMFFYMHLIFIITTSCQTRQEVFIFLG